MIAEKKVAESRQERQRLMVARRMNPAFVPTNSRRVFFFGRYKMSRMLSEIVDSDPADRTVAVEPRLREEPEADEDDEEEDDDDEDDKEDQDNDGDSDGYSE